MDIRDVGAKSDGTSSSRPAERARSGSSPRPGVAKPGSEVFFENSGQLGQARALIDVLIQTPEVRPEAVERAKALLESGTLDSAESAAAAADGILRGEEIGA